MYSKMFIYELKLNGRDETFHNHFKEVFIDFNFFLVNI